MMEHPVLALPLQALLHPWDVLIQLLAKIANIAAVACAWEQGYPYRQDAGILGTEPLVATSIGYLYGFGAWEQEGMQGTPKWQVFEDAAAVAAEAARRILGAAGSAIARRDVFRIVLAGGRTPVQTYRLLAEGSTDWNDWQVYFGDERCLPPEHEERNSRAAALAWLDRVLIPVENIHPIPAELGAEAAAAAYEPLVDAALPFDLVILGMGEDGHTASLFPGQAHPATGLVLPVHGAPKPPPDRVSLSAKALSNAREILILVTGSGKRDAVAAWRAGDPLPVAAIGGKKDVDVLIDRDASAI